MFNPDLIQTKTRQIKIFRLFLKKKKNLDVNLQKVTLSPHPTLPKHTIWGTNLSRL